MVCEQKNRPFLLMKRETNEQSQSAYRFLFTWCPFMLNTDGFLY